jgi:hypothetical protein
MMAEPDTARQVDTFILHPSVTDRNATSRHQATAVVSGGLEYGTSGRVPSCTVERKARPTAGVERIAEQEGPDQTIRAFFNEVVVIFNGTSPGY